MVNHSSQNGNVHTIIIIGLVIALIGSLGFIFWQNYSNKNASGNDTNSNSSQVKDAVDIDKQEELNNKNVIKFKELGISIVVPDSIKDITYNYETGETGGVVDGATGLSTTSITNKYAECAADGTAPPLGVLFKVDGYYPDEVNVMTTPGKLVKQFDGYYIAYRNPQSMCSTQQNDEDANGVIDEETLRMQLVESLPTIEEI